MKRYNASSLFPEEKIHIENHLEGCELCRDALEGLSLVSDPDTINSIVSEINDHLRSNLSSKKVTKNPRPVSLQNSMYYIAAAASVLILVGIFSYFKLYITDQNSELSVVTEKAQIEQNDDFKPVVEDLKPDVVVEEEIEDNISPTPIQNKKIRSSVEEQEKIPAKEVEPVVVITMNEIDAQESREEKIGDVVEDVVLDQASPIAESEEPNKYVIGGVALNGEGMDTERLSFDGDLNQEEKQLNSKRSEKKQAKGKKGKGKFAAEAVSEIIIEEDSLQDDEVLMFTVVEIPPEFPGGPDSLNKYLQKSLKYPDSARVLGIQGTVYVSFIVNKTGQVEQSMIERGIGGGCDEAALKLVQSMPYWIPGKLRSKDVNVRMVLPIKFKLE